VSGADKRMRRPARAVLVFVVAVGLLAPLALVFTQFWGSGRDELAAVELERRGLAYLRPLTGLLGQLMQAESGAVRRSGVDAQKLQAAISSVDAADSVHGRVLGTGERWRALRQRVAGLAQRPPTNAETALSDYDTAAQLTVDLIVKVGDTSGLVLEPQSDSYYLMDTVVRRLPEVISDAGYLADLVQVIDHDDSRLLTAHGRVQAAGDEAEVNLRRSLESTGRDTLDAALLGPADAFVAAVGAIGPPALFTSGAGQEADNLSTLARSLQTSAMQLHAAGLAELDTALANRHNHINGTRQWIATMVLIFLFVAATAAWFLLPRRDSSLDSALDGEDAETPESADTAGRHADRGDSGPDLSSPELIDARELLYSPELVRVGRAVRPTRRRSADDDEVGQ
jgi:hypothetical protein